MRTYLLLGIFCCLSLTILGQNTWLGINTNWNDATNWTAGIPTSSSYVRINSGPANFPVLTGNVTVDHCEMNGGSISLGSYELKSTSSYILLSTLNSAGGKFTTSEAIRFGRNSISGVITLEIDRGYVYGNIFYNALTLIANAPSGGSDAVIVGWVRPDTFKGETTFINKGSQNGIIVGVQADGSFDTTVFEKKFTFRNESTVGNATSFFGNGEYSASAKVLFKGEVVLEGTHTGINQPSVSFINAEFRQPVTVKMQGGTIHFGTTQLYTRSVLFQSSLLLDTPGTTVEFGDSFTPAMMSAAGTLSVTSGQMTTGELRFYKYRSLTTTPQLIQLSGSGTDSSYATRIITTDSTDFAGAVYLRADRVQLDGGRFAGQTTVEQLGASSAARAMGGVINSVTTLNAGGNRFLDSLIVINRRSGIWEWESNRQNTHVKGIRLTHAALGTGWISLANTGVTTLPHLTVSSSIGVSASGGIRIGYGADTVFIPANKQLITQDFSAGHLEFHHLVHKGSGAEQVLTLTDSAALRIESSTFGPKITVNTPHFTLLSSVFHQVSTFRNTRDEPTSFVDEVTFYDKVTFENQTPLGQVLFGTRDSQVIKLTTTGLDSLVRLISTLPTEVATDRHSNKIILQSGFEVQSNAQYAAIIEPAGIRPNSLVNLVPPNPDAAALGKYGEIPVSLYTGTPNIEIPLYEINRAIKVPISLSYHASGVKVDDISSMVGLGWVLNAGGVITRTVHGSADDLSGGLQTTDGRTKFNQYRANTMTFSERQTYEQLVWAGGYDTEPDEYYYNFNGRTGKLVFDHLNQPFLVNHEKLKVILNTDGFVITDEQGTKYHFTEKETTKPSTYCFDKSISETVTSAWYLSKIEPLVGRSIDFSYHTRSNITYTQGLNQTNRYYKVAGAYCTDDIQSPCKSVYRATVKQIQTITFDLGTVNFSYEARGDLGSGWYRLKEMEVKNTNNVVIKKVELAIQYDSHSPTQRYILTDVKETTDASADPIKYSFEYYNFNSLPLRNDFAQDHWGYYNNNTATTLIPNISLSRSGFTWADREPNADKSKYGILTKIIYPTSGYTVFDYEAHDFGYVKTIAGASLVEQTGGVRIAKMTHNDALTTAHQVRKYVYRFADTPNRSSGILVGRPVYHYDYNEKIHVDVDNNGTADVVSDCEFLVASSASQVYLGGSQGSHIGYQEVTEYFEDGNANGKQWHRFSSFLDFPDYGNYNTFPFPSPTSYDHARGKLREHKVYRYKSDPGTFYEVKRQINTYDFDELSSVIGEKIMKSYLNYFQGGTIFDHIAGAEDYEFKKIWMRLTQTDTYDYEDDGTNGIHQTATYEYGSNHLQLIEETHTDSPNNQVSITRYTYPLDYTIPAVTLNNAAQAIKDMQDNNVISTVIEQRQITKYGMTEKTDAAQVTTFYPATALAHQVYSFSSGKGETSWTTGSINGSGVFEKDTKYSHDATYDQYDGYGNLQQITPASGVTESLMWGHDSKLPIVRAVGVPYSVLIGVNGSAPSLTGGSIESYSESVKSYLASNAILGHVYTYVHEPLQGLQSVLAPNDLRTSFGYDGFQRLRWIKDHNGNYLNRYLYHYKASSGDKNYIKTATLRVATGTESDADDADKAEITLNYLDGLGRNVQTVGYQRSPSHTDVVMKHVVYDQFGRINKEVLPTLATTNTGEYQNTVITLAQNFYTPDTAPFSESIAFDQSPLNRVRQAVGSGQAWRDNNKKTNLYDESAGSDVRFYYLNSDDNLVLDGTYPTNSLFKKRIVDEQGNTTIEIRDMRGRLIQKQQQDDSNFITTHYIYDGSGKIRAVLQPEGYKLEESIDYNSAKWNQWVFFYRYDSRGRLIEKKVPGAGLEEFVYDRWDRLVWKRTAFQTEQGKWSFMKYDALNRLIISGETTRAGDRTSLQTEAAAATTHHESRNTTGPVYYSLNSGYPTIPEESIRSISYFDNYTNWPATGIGFDAGNAYHSQYANVTALPTGMRSRNGSGWLVSVNYYENKGRVIQTFAHNLYGKPERTDIQYNFVGEVLKNRHYRIDQNDAATTQVLEHNYDHAGRKTKLYQSINGATSEQLALYSYDGISRLIQKKIMPNNNYSAGGVPPSIVRPPNPANNTQDLATQYIRLKPGTTITAGSGNTYMAQITAPSGGVSFTGLQSIDYKYHIRGGLLGVNLNTSLNPIPNSSEGDLFSYKLEYETAAYWDENVGKQSWQSTQNNSAVGVRSYTYNYDKASRLKSATYTGINGENFSMSDITYDKNGNISTLKRKGKNGSSFGDIDNLTYYYSGNELTGVTDGISGNEDVGDFKDNGSSSDYTYWNDGSLKSDANKGISQIDYDSFLQRVKQVTFSNGNWLKFFYDGEGTLLKRTNSLGDVWEYTAGTIYKNSVPYQMSMPEGRVTYTNSNWINEFEYRDHQNNLRVVFKEENGQLVQTQTSETDPFGLEIQPLSIAESYGQNFRFQNQEKVSDFGLNLNWFKYRPEDPQIGRFWQVDLLATDYPHNSTYAFSENKVIRHVELDGLEAVDFVYGIGAALRDDFGTPDGRSNIQDRPGFVRAFNNGRTVGHSVAALSGIIETLGGIIGALGSGAGELLSAGAASPIALPALAASAAAAGHGANSAANAVSNLIDDKGRVQSNSNNDNLNNKNSNGYAPKAELPRNPDGTPAPDPNASGPHTQLGTKPGRKGDYRQAREFDAKGNPVKDIDFTDHGRPKTHPNNPHQHDYKPNPTGGTPQRDKNPKPLSY